MIFKKQIQRFARYISRAAQVPYPQITTLGLLTTPSEEMELKPLKTVEDYLECYAGWIYAAVTTIAWDVRSSPWAVYRKKGKRRDDWEPLEQDELHPVFNRANAIDTFGDLIELVSIHMDTTGEAFLLILDEIAGRKSSEVQGLQIIYPHWIEEPEYTEDRKYLTGWKLKTTYGGGKKTIKIKDMIFFKYPSPVDPIRGASPIEAFAVSYDLDMYSRAYGAAFLKNYTVPPLYIVSDNPELSQKQADDIADAWVDRQLRKPGRPAVVRSGVKVDKIGFALKDLEFAAIAKLSRDQIFGCYKFNSVILGIRDGSTGISQADAKIYERAYQRNCLRPRLRRIEEEINNFLMPRLYPGESDLKFEFDDPVREDEDAKFERTVKLVEHGMIQINQGLSILGHEKQEDGDVYIVQSNSERVPAGQLDKPSPKEKQVPPKAEERTHAFEKDSVLRELAELRFLNSQEKLERIAKSKIRARFSAEQKKMIKALSENYPQRSTGKSSVDVSGLNDYTMPHVVRRDWVENVLNSESDEWINVMRQIILQSVERGFELFAAEFEDAVSFELFKRQAAEYARRQAAQKIVAISDYTAEKVRGVIAKAVEGGWSIGQTRQALSELYDGFKGVRSETIARTETGQAVNYGKYWDARETGKRLQMELRKTWVATIGDTRTRDSHRAANGKTVDIDEMFPVGDSYLRHPGDSNGPAGEVINCRCTITFREKRK